MQKHTVDARRILFVFDTLQELIDYTVDHFVRAAQSAIDERGRFTVALSGGSTPKSFLEALSRSDKAKKLGWKHICIFWSDERAVTPDHADSNYKMAMQFLQGAPFSQATFLRMQAEREDRDAAALEYETSILKYCPDGVLDLIYLGIGEDGHTASLFPGSEALKEQKKLVVSCYVEAKNAWRETFTFPLINRAREIIVLATGSGKAAILKEILFNKEAPHYPAEAVGTKASPALFFSDRAAASLCIS